VVTLCACLNSIGALPNFPGVIFASSRVALDIRFIEFNKQSG